jgi:hypothetical protein
MTWHGLSGRPYWLVPLAASVLRPILLHRIPHKSSPRALQCQYLRAAFRLVETPAGASLRDALLQGVVAHLLEAGAYTRPLFSST